MGGTTAAIAVAAALALVAIVVMRRGKGQRSEWDTALTALGIEPVSALDPELTAAIIALHRPPVADPNLKQTWSLTRIGRYPEPGVSCYTVTLHLEQQRAGFVGSKQQRHESSETRVVAVVAPQILKTPRMQLLPRAVVAPDAGALATMAAQAANAMIDSAAEHGGTRVEFAEDPAFERQYLVLSSEPVPARALLDSSRRKELSGLDGVQMSLEGSLMLVSSPTDAIRARGRSTQEALSAELENARRALRAFATR
jgi:hypothetical protein